MKNELIGKEIIHVKIENYEKSQKIGFMNKNLDEYQNFVNGKIVEVLNRGSSILVNLDNNFCLLLGPEYGGEFFFLNEGVNIPDIYNILLTFTDGTQFSGRLKGMGVILSYNKSQLENSYIYKREFKGGPSPLDENFDYELFKALTSNKKRQLKSVLVGKDAAIVGLMNSAFQDIIYRANLHPKRRMSDLDETERISLYNSIINLIEGRIAKNGKTEFSDLYGKKGEYIPLMGPNMKDESCTICRTPIAKISHGGGQVYLCPECQIEP
ncbi:MAG: hypothetical protein INQ03_06045 [Candidatus Heimdallarchaeota archaeon]|nr:hypothetical protein [Candidatus Heimdallarchaeota archaeon]